MAAIGLSTAAAAQTLPGTTTTNQNSVVNPAAIWTHPYWDATSVCASQQVTGACDPVVPILNPNQNSPLNSTFDYYAYSPPVTKFVDPLPTVPIAVPVTTIFSGQKSDYYELSVEDFMFPFHRDMGPAFLRGYQQTNAPSGSTYNYMDANGTSHSVALGSLHQNNLGYMGPQIVNYRNVPTRVKMTNNKSITNTTWDSSIHPNTPHTYKVGNVDTPIPYNGLQIPVDETMTGAGSGPPVHLSAGRYATHSRASTVAGLNILFANNNSAFHSNASSYKYYTNSQSTSYYPVGTFRYHTAAGNVFTLANRTTLCGPSLNPPVAAGPGCTQKTGFFNGTAWVANSTCTNGQFNLINGTYNPYLCVQIVVTAANTTVCNPRITGVGSPACTPTWTPNTLCPSPTPAGATCATDTWTLYKSCTAFELTVPGIASSCTTAVRITTTGNQTATAACSAAVTRATTDNPAPNAALPFHCSTGQTWAIGSVCAPYIPATNNSPFFCQLIAGWARGDYCTTTQANDANYACIAGDYSFDRALLHQHGGVTPWISDGQPHQWTTPVGDNNSPYKRGLSNANVADMPCSIAEQISTTDPVTGKSPCDGINTYFYSNQNSARMMWYHDHSSALTRLNLYAGEVSLYMLTDSIEQAMLGNGATNNSAIDNVFKSVGLASDAQIGTNANYQPQPDLNRTVADGQHTIIGTLGTTIAIQDKTFVWGYDSHSIFGKNGTGGNAALYGTNAYDGLWAGNKDGGNVGNEGACGKIAVSTASTNGYAEFPGNPTGGPMGQKKACPMDTGALWFPHVYSPNTDPTNGATVAGARWDFAPWVYPAGTIYNQYLPTVSAVPESFLDTMVTNGKAYPYQVVPRKPMRYRIINASNERYLNLQLYYAVNNSGVASGTNTTPFNVDPATICNKGGSTAGSGFEYAKCTEVGMILQNPTQQPGAYLAPVPAYIVPNANMVDSTGATWVPGTSTGQAYMPTNAATWARYGGVPDPTTQVPFIQIGNEGGFLPNPIVHYNQSLDVETDPRNITLTNVRNNPVSNPPTCANCVFPYPGYTLYMGPGERADIIIDFGSIPDGATLILYNDMLAPNPGYDQRYDLFTGAPDMTAINGPAAVLPGQGPNTRTIMQFRVDGTINFAGANPTDPVTGAASYNKPLPAGWVEEINMYNGDAAKPANSAAPLNKAIVAAFAASHVDPIASAEAKVGGKAARVYNYVNPNTVGALPDNTPFYMGSIDPPVFMDLSAGAVGSTVKASCDGSDTSLVGCAPSRLCTYGASVPCSGGITEFPTCANSTRSTLTGKIDNSKDPGYRITCGFPVFTKAIAEDFDPPFGRINALLGNEQTSLEANGQQTYGFPFVQPITERLHEGETQIWQTIHNGVDVHTVHFHLMNVQVINRIDWAGIPKLPDAEERGWRDLIKMNPLETIVFAVRLNRPGHNADDTAGTRNPVIPFPVPTSMRVSDVTSAVGEVDPAANAAGQQMLVPFLPFGNGIATYANAVEDFSWEYIWHCHLLGHEEADMMRPLVVQIDPGVNMVDGSLSAHQAGEPSIAPPDGLIPGVQ